MLIYLDVYYGTGRYGKLHPEIDSEMRQLEKILPVFRGYFRDCDQARYWAARECMEMVDVLLNVTMDERQAWECFLSFIKDSVDPENEFSVRYQWDKANAKAFKSEEDVSQPTGEVIEFPPVEKGDN